MLSRKFYVKLTLQINMCDERNYQRHTGHVRKFSQTLLDHIFFRQLLQHFHNLLTWILSYSCTATNSKTILMIWNPGFSRIGTSFKLLGYILINEIIYRSSNVRIRRFWVLVHNMHIGFKDWLKTVRGKRTTISSLKNTNNICV